jgi:[ribosomal protein S18]-alanine N-acetyltransferase
MDYRLYTPSDFKTLYRVEETCFEPAHRFSRRYMRDLVDDPNGATWIAEENGVMAGFAIVDWMRESAEVIAYIQTIEVKPEWRGLGVGHELMGRIEASARAAGARVIWLHVDAANDPAIALYERHGYLRRRRHEGYYGRGRPALVYAKELGDERSPQGFVQ